MRGRRLTGLFIVSAGLAAAATSTRAQNAQASVVDTTTVEYRALLTPDLTQADVRRRAIEGALAEAVRRVAGVQVQSGTMAVKEEKNGSLRDDFISVVQLDARGRVVDYVILDEEWITTRHPELGSQVYLRLRLRASVAHEIGNPDPAFRITLSLNTTVLEVRSRRPADNDELVATVSTNRDAELTLLILADDSVTVLFPNEYVSRTALKAGVEATFPTDEWRRSGLRLRATLPEGREARRELVLAIATRGPVSPFVGATALALQRWLSAIPMEQRTMASAVVDVRR
ncbi:MAG: DUF4384 domain-containing protein [Gemmatimonadaceae bacterium]